MQAPSRIAGSASLVAAALLLCGAVAACARHGDDSAAGATADSTAAGGSAVAENTASASGGCRPTGETRDVTCEVRAFLSTLSDSQRRAVVIPFTAELAQRWSNLPCGLECRNGLQLASLSGPQRVAALRLAETALGPSGYRTFDVIRKADAFLGAQPQPAGGGPPPGGPPPGAPTGGRQGGIRPGGGAGGPGGPGGLQYSELAYTIAVLGAPSDSGRWMLQVGGHHHAANLTYAGGATAASITPNFVGVEPQSFTLEGKTYAPLDARRNAIYAILQALDDKQRQGARLSHSFTDVLLGPGQDGRFPEREGIPVGTLTGAQRALVRSAIEAWVGDAPPALAATLMSDYGSDAALAATRVAWSGATTPTVQGSYVRIDGPKVWIEFVCQNGVVIQGRIHYHTIWRDKTRDYGGSFTF